MKLPKDCKMTDLSNLKENRLIPALVIKLLAFRGKVFSEEAGFHLRNFVRLVDKAIQEYQEARSSIISQIEEQDRSLEEMQQEGRVIYMIVFVNHIENCINATRRLFHLLEALKREDVIINRRIRRLVESYENSVINVRDAVEHIDEKIRKDEFVNGLPVMLAISDDEKSVQIANYSLRFSDLKNTIEKFYDIAKTLIESYN